jgi:glycosyltransferase involved in cell wall biosynthesis
MSKLTILSIAYPFAPVGLDAVGGAEQVLTHVERAIADSGHRSIVVACEGSETAGTLVATPLPKGTLDDEAKKKTYDAHRQGIARAMSDWPVDVVHMHGIDFDRYLPPGDVPTLVTMHLPLSWYPGEVFRLRRPHTYLHCVSMSQYRTCPPGAHVLPAIENGVPVGELSRYRHRRRNFAVALGRICPEKNFHVALDAGSMAGVPVYLGGEVFPYEAHQRYFEDEIRPRLSGRHRFLGPLGLTRKRRLLSAARCLISASVAPETSSLVAMEAIACGTPVVALPSGALPEIVEHGRTGFIVKDIREMADAIEATGFLDEEAIRETARRRFSVERMAARYLAVYDHLSKFGGLVHDVRESTIRV